MVWIELEFKQFRVGFYCNFHHLFSTICFSAVLNLINYIRALLGLPCSDSFPKNGESWFDSREQVWEISEVEFQNPLLHSMGGRLFWCLVLNRCLVHGMLRKALCLVLVMKVVSTFFLDVCCSHDGHFLLTPDRRG